MAASYTGALPSHGRFDYQAIHQRAPYRWPQWRGLGGVSGFQHGALCLWRRYGRCHRPRQPARPDVLNYSWREYGNRVGAWRCLELFDRLHMPTAAIVNTALYDHCPELVAACVARGDELVGHGHTNAERQGVLDEASERALLVQCRDRMLVESGQTPAGWLSPWISESLVTPDLLAETGYGLHAQLVPRRSAHAYANTQRAAALGRSLPARAQ